MLNGSELLLTCKMCFFPSRKFECELCERSFSEKWALNNHMKLHMGNKPFKCSWPSCHYAFLTLSAMKDHLRTHTGLYIHNTQVLIQLSIGTGCASQWKLLSVTKRNLRFKSLELKMLLLQGCRLQPNLRQFFRLMLLPNWFLCVINLMCRSVIL